MEATKVTKDSDALTDAKLAISAMHGKIEGHHRFTILIHFNSRYSVSLKNKKLHVLEFFQYHDMTFNDCNKDIYFLFTDVCSISKPCSVCM